MFILVLTLPVPQLTNPGPIGPFLTAKDANDHRETLHQGHRWQYVALTAPKAAHMPVNFSLSEAKKDFHIQPNHEDLLMALVHEDSNVPVPKGWTHEHSGRTLSEQGGRAPHKFGSTGKVFLTKSCLEYYPSVVGLKWLELSEVQWP
jgi:hypothetical protein